MSADTNAKQLAASAALMKAARRWHSLSKQCLSSLPLTEACAEPLLLLKRLGEPVHQATLAQMAGLSDPTLSRLIEQLAYAGLVKRLSYPGDRRANSVFLTEKGHEVASAAEVRLAELRSRALAKTSDDDLDTTLRVLQAFFNAERGQA
jgi:MarR family transcriptional regulator for hemolysin